MNPLERDRKGEEPLYRPRHWRRIGRRRQKRAKKENLFRGGGNKAVIFVPSTPHSQLKKRHQDIVRGTKLKIKTVEKSGKTLKSTIQRSNPFGQPKCSIEEECLVCRGEMGNCKRGSNV